jgi:predicted transcriptional regulator
LTHAEGFEVNLLYENPPRTRLTVMTPIPNYRPKQLSLGPLEAEILNIIWALGSVTVKDVHKRILADPDRELAYTSVTTVLRRLTQKGWLACDRRDRTFSWRPLVSRSEAQALEAYDQLHKFLAVGNPDVVAAFADSLDTASLEQIEAIALRLQAARKAREEE